MINGLPSAACAQIPSLLKRPKVSAPSPAKTVRPANLVTNHLRPFSDTSSVFIRHSSTSEPIRRGCEGLASGENCPCAFQATPCHAAATPTDDEPGRLSDGWHVTFGEREGAWLAALRSRGYDGCRWGRSAHLL